jgi:hypothetical protein
MRGLEAINKMMEKPELILFNQPGPKRQFNVAGPTLIIEIPDIEPLYLLGKDYGNLSQLFTAKGPEITVYLPNNMFSHLYKSL